MAKDTKHDDDFGFEPITDEGVGFQTTPDQKAKMESYLKNTQPSMGASALAGAEQGLTMNHAPQLAGAIGAGLEKGAGMMGMGPQAANAKLGLPQQSLSDLYNEYKKSTQKKDEAAQQANPMSYGAGAVSGGLLGFKGAGMLAKPAMAGISAANPTLGATAQVMNKMAPGALPAMAAGGLAVSAVAPPVIGGVAKGAAKTASAVKTLGGLAGETLTGGEAGNSFGLG